MQKILKSIIDECKSLLSSWFSNYNISLPYLLLSALAIALVIGGISLFVELTEVLKTEELAKFDTAITNIVMSYQSDSLTQFVIFITDIGGLYGYIVVFFLCSLLFYLLIKKWQYVVQLGIVMILALSSNMFLKQVINRSRPEIEHLVTVKTMSYPSGHAMTAMAFYGFLIFLTYSFKMNSIVKFILISLFAFLILSIGISRIYLGVHFPSDVVGGFIAGFIWVILCALVFDIIKIFRKDTTELKLK